MDMVELALVEAKKAHGNQTRRIGNVPYYEHLLDVAKNLLWEELDDYIVAAGILHDTLEDTEYDENIILDKFGHDVYRLVKFCSEPENTCKKTDSEMTASWMRRKEHTVKIAKDAKDDELYVLMADKVSNLSSLKRDILIYGEEIWNEFHNPKDTKWYYDEILKIMDDRLPDSKMIKIYKILLDDVFNK